MADELILRSVFVLRHLHHLQLHPITPFVASLRTIIYDHLGTIRYCLSMPLKLNKDLIEVHMESTR